MSSASRSRVGGCYFAYLERCSVCRGPLRLSRMLRWPFAGAAPKLTYPQLCLGSTVLTQADAVERKRLESLGSYSFLKYRAIGSSLNPIPSYVRRAGAWPGSPPVSIIATDILAPFIQS